MPDSEIARDDILLVEDDAGLREVLSQYLRQSGYTVHEAANGKAAIKYLAGNTVRVVITDLFMPETDGLELLAHLRNTRSPTPIIAMSDRLLEDTKLYLKIARHLGARHALAKPFPLPVLVAAVRESIAGQRPANP